MPMLVWLPGLDRQPLEKLMPTLQIRGAHINYETLGNSGPWVALSPGGRRPLQGVKHLAERVAAHGYRVLIHDRRNTGASDVVFEGTPDAPTEYEIWAEDLYAMLKHFNATPAWVGGGSSGCRMSVLLALKHPDAVRGLLLWRVTGGEFAARRLAQQYYFQFIEAAKKGGMAAVCASEHFAERVKERPVNRDAIMKQDVNRFIGSFQQWAQGFLDDANKPVIGATAEQLASLKVPTILVPGNDKTHDKAIGERAHKHIKGAEIYHLFPDFRMS
ncbi:MAG: alpha/beta hydrolase, partial [Betaproteobacteria bacterium]|nr:alpha/beta hydrolase [Betaproteobacteria bacterium]